MYVSVTCRWSVKWIATDKRKMKEHIMNDICAVGICKKLAVVITSAMILVLGLQKPFHNWDMIAYVAAAHKQDGLQGKDLSLATYEDIKREVGSTDFQPLIEGKYRASVFDDPNSLDQQLPFYNIKVVYIELMRLLKQVGITYPIATYLISACFASASILLLAALCAHFSVSPLLIPFIALYSDYSRSLSFLHLMRSQASLRC
jgi:hypothetical protein